MATRTITETIRKQDGSAWANAPVRFELDHNSFRPSPPETYPVSPFIAFTNSAGLLSVNLVSGVDIVYNVTTPDRVTFKIAVPDGGATTLAAARASYSGVPATVNSIQSVLSSMFPGGIAPINVESNDAAVVTQATTLDFGTGLLTSQGPTGEANVSVDLGTSAVQAALGNHTHTLGAGTVPLSALDKTGAIRGDTPFHDGTNIIYLATPYLFLGPWHFVDQANSTTAEGNIQRMTAATAVATNLASRSRFPMPFAARVIAGWLLGSTPITSGQATLQVGINGTGNAAFSNAARLDTTNTIAISGADIAGGIAVTAGQSVSAVVVTSATFAPVSNLDMQAWLLVRLEA